MFLKYSQACLSFEIILTVIKELPFIFNFFSFTPFHTSKIIIFQIILPLEINQFHLTAWLAAAGERKQGKPNIRTTTGTRAACIFNPRSFDVREPWTTKVILDPQKDIGEIQVSASFPSSRAPLVPLSFQKVLPFVNHHTMSL